MLENECEKIESEYDKATMEKRDFSGHLFHIHSDEVAATPSRVNAPSDFAVYKITLVFWKTNFDMAKKYSYMYIGLLNGEKWTHNRSRCIRTY